MNSLIIAKTILSKALSIPVDSISDQASIDQLNHIDSVQFVSIIAGIENHLKKEIEVNDLLELSTVEDLSNLIEKYSIKN